MMHEYSQLQLSTSYCLHFVRNYPLDADDQEITDELKRQGVGIFYLDYLEARRGLPWIMDTLANVLELENRPYEGDWFRFVDDMITLAQMTRGAIIVIDNADVFLDERRNEMLDLVESLVRPLRHWLEQKKPYHICFQMDPDPLVRRIFGRSS